MMPIKSPNSFMLLVLDVNCTTNILSCLDKKRQIQEEGGRHLYLNHATVWIHTTRSFMVNYLVIR